MTKNLKKNTHFTETISFHKRATFVCVWGAGGGGKKTTFTKTKTKMNKQKVILFLNKNFLLKMMKTELFRETYLYVPKIL